MSLRTTTAWALGALCLLNASPAWAERHVYAITIGYNGAPEAQPTLGELRFADDDALRMYDLLSRSADQAWLLTVPDADSQVRFPAHTPKARRPSLANLRRALDQLQTRMGADLARGDIPVLFLTYSGHGSATASGELALTLADGTLTRAMLYAEVLEPFGDAEVHLIVDACRAGGVVGVRGAFDREMDAQLVETAEVAPALLEQDGLARFPNVGALLAASGSQRTHEWSGTASGVFTHEVLSALAGGADVNGDRRIEYTEVEAFVAAANRTLPDRGAAPRLLAHPPRGNARAVLLRTDELANTYLLHGTGHELGRFSVVLDNGVRWLDAHPESGMRVALAVPQGVGKYLRTEGAEARLPARSKAPVELASVQLAPVQSQSRGPLDESYGRELFRTPFGPVYYRGYVDHAGLPSVAFDAASTETALAATRTDAAPHALRRRRTALGTFGAAAALTVASAISGGLTLQSKRAYDSTPWMAPAESHREAYRTRGLVTAATGATALLGWIVGAWIWPGKETTPARAALEGTVRW